RLRIPALFLLLLLPGFVSAAAQPDRGYEIATSRQIKIGAAVIQVDFAAGQMDLPLETVLAHIQSAASAVSGYYGKFPVNHVRVLVIPVDNRRGMIQGTTWGDMHGFQGFTRLRIGQHMSAEDLAEDWVTTHEMVHMAFPTLPDDQ